MAASLEWSQLKALPAAEARKPRGFEALATLDRASFEQLYAEHAGAVFGYCLRRLQDRQAAEDMTQRAFIQAWHKRGSYREESFLGWMLAIARNESASLLKRTRTM